VYFIRAMLLSQADGYRGLLACSAGALSFVTTECRRLISSGDCMRHHSIHIDEAQSESTITADCSKTNDVFHPSTGHKRYRQP
jgi:hypothetical protein